MTRCVQVATLPMPRSASGPCATNEGITPVLKTVGRLIVGPRETPLCNLSIAMLERTGCDTARLGDSAGNLAGSFADGRG
jgi:hypothetical protein